MDNFSIKLNFKKFKNAGILTIKGKSGNKKCVCIPLEDNPEIFEGEKGVYLGLTAVTMKEEGKYGDTHFIKGNLPEDIYKAMSQEERRALPIIGQMKPLTKKSQPAPEVEVEEDEDLPF